VSPDDEGYPCSGNFFADGSNAPMANHRIVDKVRLNPEP
jgi:hypothetical protein